ncbi:MAG TPA: NAD-dependent epimerase/dehydratase family protein, partial [Candidatus Acidoferrales bacterium]|nr:NAD-dependent epimerase/dehydratase family protein [Candidatus Acidoferrales bacterium]
MKSRVLVTGASGFIGWNCLWMLLSKGYEVHAVSRQAAPEGVSPEVIWHQLNLLDPGCAAQIIGRVRPERLLHLAWYAVTGSFWEAAENVEWVRVSLDLLRAFAEGGGKRTVAACSCAEYDMTAGECAETTTLLLPQTLYGQSKLAFEKAGQEAARQAGLSAAWGRVFFMYGPRENAARPVAHVVKSLMKGEPAECSEGAQVLDVSHVEDIAGGLVALLESSVQGPVNIGTGNPVTLRTVFET